MNTLALTFDNGPDPRWTPRLLDVLADAGALATFFPIAPRAAAHPALMARMVSEGHAVGLHCDAHQRHSRRCAAWVRADTVAAENGLRVVEWSVDTHDWRGTMPTPCSPPRRAGCGPARSSWPTTGLDPAHAATTCARQSRTLNS